MTRYGDMVYRFATTVCCCK